jgi:hypothetical protein
VFLSFVDPSLVREHLDGQVVDSAGVVRLLEYRAIPAGTPVFLDEVTMRPVEPLCSWFRHLVFEEKDAKTLREYAYIVRRFVHFLQSRDRVAPRRGWSKAERWCLPMFLTSGCEGGMNMADNEIRDIEIRVLRDVIDAVDARLGELQSSGHKIAASRGTVHARVLYAVIASARETGHYGVGMLVKAPLLDVILSGAEGTDWDKEVFAVLMDLPAHN